MRTVLLLLVWMLTTADLRAADVHEQHQIEVRIGIYIDMSGEDEPYVIKLGTEPKMFTFKIEDAERLSLKMTLLDGCKVSVEILGRENVTTTRPLSWPSAFEPGATFAIGVHFPHHRQEVRGSVSGVGACSRTSDAVHEIEWAGPPGAQARWIIEASDVRLRTVALERP